jgi:hypothetical protein
MPATTTNLYRRGNASGPRLTKVRIGKDIATYQRGGIEWIAARSGGVSTFSARGPGENWWLLPRGSIYPADLHVVNDHGDHYNWEPNVDMPLSTLISLLASMEPLFRKVT